MSTVFQKTLIDTCLVLDSREALTCPFDLGNWSEIRVGVELSYVSSTGAGYNIVPGADEHQAATVLTNGFLMGLRNTGTPFPDNVSGVYLGFVPTATNTHGIAARISEGRIIDDFINTFLPVGMINGPAIVTNLSNSTSKCVYIGGTSVSGTTNYAAQQGIRIRMTGQNTPGQYMMIDVFNNTLNYVTPNVTGLRFFLSNMPNVASGFYGPLTNTFTSNGTPLAVPNAFFVYSPFQSGILRVHTIIVDRYA